ELVRRHGPMVLGVCRRIVGDAHAAEDAFQATFLVLARRAAAVWPRERVGNWLYGVACRTARAARSAAARRLSSERQFCPFPDPPEPGPDAPVELLALLDEEIERLPERLRTAVVLCELQGRSRAEAARLLGVPEGTLSSRLAAARQRLAARLRRRGLVATSRALAAALRPEPADAALAGAALPGGPSPPPGPNPADRVLRGV